MSTTIDLEVSDYILNQVATIPLNLNNITDTEVVINIVNADSATTILLDIFFIEGSGLNLKTVDIISLSQCNIEIVNHFSTLHITTLNLINVALTKQPALEVEYFTIQSSEAITTSLPAVTKRAEISILPSDDMLSVQKMLQGVNIIPGSGEYVYDTKIHNFYEHKMVKEITYIVEGGPLGSKNGVTKTILTPLEEEKRIFADTGKAMNANNPEHIADTLYNIKSLKKSCPNVKWVAPVVSWFGVNKQKVVCDFAHKRSACQRPYDISQLDMENIDILPAVEHRDKKILDNWHVAQYDRAKAHLISVDKKGRPNYGGTINDESLERYIDSLHDNGYKIMLYPMVLMDSPKKPWRGHIFCNNVSKIHEFFVSDTGYNKFIIHYANLLKGKIDAFVIGSEFKELTSVIDVRFQYPDVKRYPVVVELIELAKQVKSILGKEVIVTYAADWSEYHHHEEGFYHLDPLWASDYIDVVGIDAYFPLTNKTKGNIYFEDIKLGWESGELWDFYYDGNGRNKALAPEWGLKQIEHWWSNNHTRSGIQSLWEPKMKPIWFTEFGFPSISMATNQPNVFWNPEAKDGGAPKYSSESVNFAIQMRAIRATLEYWQSKSEIVQNMFLWTWDARPYPSYPERLDIWSDGDLWIKGHWINGKIEPVSQVTLLSDFNVNILSVYAEKLIIKETNSQSSAKLIIADQVYLPKLITGANLGIKARIIHLQKVMSIKLSGTLLLDCENDLTFASEKTSTTRNEDIARTKNNYYDECIEQPIIKTNQLIIKAPNLRLESTEIFSKNIIMQLKNLELVSEKATHIRNWEWIGKPNWRGKSSHEWGSKTGEQAYITVIRSENISLELEGKLYARGAFIETQTFNGYANQYTFEALALTSEEQKTNSNKRNFLSFKPPKISKAYDSDDYFHGATLIIADKGYAFSENEILFSGSYLMGEDMELEAKSITFKAAIGKHFSAFEVKEQGMRFFASSKSGELVLGVSDYYKYVKSENYFEKAFYAGAFVNKLKIKTDKLVLSGGILAGKNISINAKEIVNESPMLIGFYQQTQIDIEYGIKIGFQESIRSTIDSMKAISNNVGGSNPALTSAINFVSNGRKAIMQATNIANGNGVQGGVWAFGEASISHMSVFKKWGLSNIINADNFEVNGTSWHMEGLDLTAKNCTINVKEIIAHFTYDEEMVKSNNGDASGQIGLIGGVSSGGTINYNGAKIHDIRQHTNHITVSGAFNLNADKVEGGLTIEANELSAIVDVLKLVSKQDTSSQSGKAFSASIGVSKGKLTSGSIYGQKNGAYSEITRDGRSGLFGKNMLLVKSSELIYLEGAYLDSSNGNLKVEAASIKTATLKDKSTSWGAGFGVDSGNAAFGVGTRITGGEKDQKRDVPGAVGNGVIIIGDQEIDEAMSVFLGISRKTNLEELKGSNWYLDATFRRVNSDEFAKAWSGGPSGIAERIVGNIEGSIGDVLESIDSLLKAGGEILKIDQVDDLQKTKNNEDIISPDGIPEKEKQKEQDKNLQKSKLPDHLMELYNEVEERTEAMELSDADKNYILNRMYNNLKKISSDEDQDFKFLTDIFAFRDKPNIWYLENLSPNEDETIRNARFDKEWKEHKMNAKKEIEIEENLPEYKAKMEQERLNSEEMIKSWKEKNKPKGFIKTLLTHPVSACIFDKVVGDEVEAVSEMIITDAVLATRDPRIIVPTYGAIIAYKAATAVHERYKCISDIYKYYVVDEQNNENK